MTTPPWAGRVPDAKEVPPPPLPSILLFKDFPGVDNPCCVSKFFQVRGERCARIVGMFVMSLQRCHNAVEGVRVRASLC